MLKRIFGKKLSRSRTSRDALVRSQVRALVENGKVVTSLARAKMVRIYVEKYFSAGVKGDLSLRRRVLARLANDTTTTRRIFDIAQKSGKKGGFAKIVQLPPRRGDATKMARLELVGWFAPEPKKERAKKETKIGQEAETPKKVKAAKAKKVKK